MAHGLSRRGLLTGAAGAAALWTPIGRVYRAGDGPELYRTRYRNWSGETTVDDVWTSAPRTPSDVVTLANWAHANGYTLRAQGHRHGWSPLTIAAGATRPPILVDTTASLTAMTMLGTDAVRVGAGAALEDLLEFLHRAGRGLTATPAPGDLSVGGALAIDAHGTAVPAAGERPAPGGTYGSLSNRILSLTAVVWDAAAGGFTLRTFDRAEPDCAAFLTHLGRAFVTEATLRVGPDHRLRCVSRVDITAAELFDTGLETFLTASGRIEVIWFPFTARPWLKVWTVAPERPPTSRPVTGPYNYPFSDNVPRPVAELAGRIAAGEDELAPLLGRAQYGATVAGLTATASADLWGAAKNTQLYLRPTTLRMHANGYAVPARRADVQRVVRDFTSFFSRRLAAYAAGGRYPVNGAVEIRVTGLDHPIDAGAVTPALSALAPWPDRPEWDVAVWLDILTIPGTPHANAFYREIERYLFDAFPGTRVEWSKGWAYTPAAAWSDPEVLGRLPASLRGWSGGVATLDRHDPHRIFTNPFLDRLLV